jgi:hypothetical protein
MRDFRRVPRIATKLEFIKGFVMVDLSCSDPGSDFAFRKSDTQYIFACPTSTNLAPRFFYFPGPREIVSGCRSDHIEHDCIS